MKKSVYSLVLMDDVVKAVDKQAMLLGTNRSNLINQILAEHLSCITPEMRMRDIFGYITQLLNEEFQIQPCRSDALITLRSALEYKYRPTINYKVELFRNPDKYFGVLKVNIRTQNTSLTKLFNNFFLYWINFENKYFSQFGINGYSCELSTGLFTRHLFNLEERSDELTASAIRHYIILLDKAVKHYFSSPQSFDVFADKYENEYAERLQHTII